MSDEELEAILWVMAEDAFDVLNWARRLGLKKEGQLSQVVSALKKTLKDTGSTLTINKS